MKDIIIVGDPGPGRLALTSIKEDKTILIVENQKQTPFDPEPFVITNPYARLPIIPSLKGSKQKYRKTPTNITKPKKKRR